MQKASKRYLIMGIIFSLMSILFLVLYHFKFIKTLNLMLTLVYVLFFVGVALLYNGAYLRTLNKNKSTAINFFVSILLMVVSMGLLIYGLSSGAIDLF